MSEKKLDNYHMQKFKVAIEQTTDMMLEPLDYDDFIDSYNLKDVNDILTKENFKVVFSQLRSFLKDEILTSLFKIVNQFDTDEFFALKFMHDEKMKIKKLMSDFKENVLCDENTEMSYKEVFRLLNKVEECNKKYETELENDKNAVK